MSIISKLSQQIFTTEVGLSDYNKFDQMRSHEGFQEFLYKYLNVFIGLMLEDMLSRRYTKLPPEEKDVQQRVYFEVNNLIQWILRPETEAKRLNLIKQHNRKMTATLKGKPKGEA
jgi:hypothetical protein